MFGSGLLQNDAKANAGTAPRRVQALRKYRTNERSEENGDHSKLAT